MSSAGYLHGRHNESLSKSISVRLLNASQKDQMLLIAYSGLRQSLLLQHKIVVLLCGCGGCADFQVRMLVKTADVANTSDLEWQAVANFEAHKF